MDIRRSDDHALLLRPFEVAGAAYLVGTVFGAFRFDTPGALLPPDETIALLADATENGRLLDLGLPKLRREFFVRSAGVAPAPSSDETIRVEIPPFDKTLAAGMPPSPALDALPVFGADDDARWRGIAPAALADPSPVFPEDFDWRAFNLAPADQQLDGFFLGDETVRLHGIVPSDDFIDTALPDKRLHVFLEQHGPEEDAFLEVPPRLDTVCLLPDRNAGLVIWRVVFQVESPSADDLARLGTVIEPMSEPPREPDEYYEWLFGAPDASVRSDEIATGGPVGAASPAGLIDALGIEAACAGLPEAPAPTAATAAMDPMQQLQNAMDALRQKFGERLPPDAKLPDNLPDLNKIPKPETILQKLIDARLLPKEAIPGIQKAGLPVVAPPLL